MLRREKGSPPKRALLPSELKRILKERQTKRQALGAERALDVPDALSLPCFQRAPVPSPTSACASLWGRSSEREALAPLSSNRPLVRADQTIIAPTPASQDDRNPPRASWALLKQLTVSLPAALLSWQQHLHHRTLPSSRPEDLSQVMDRLSFYRFPFPSLPIDHQQRLSKMFHSQRSVRGEEPLESQYFRHLVDHWRSALLSLYERLKTRQLDFFYHIQPELVILFTSNTTKVTSAAGSEQATIKALITKANKSLSEVLRREGIEFSQGMGAIEEEQESMQVSLHLEDPPPAEDSDQENVDPSIIRSMINRRLDSSQRRHSQHRSTAGTVFRVEGEGAVHSLVDYLLNQRDGRSFVVMPELIAPGPFLYGTLCQNDLSMTGPLSNGQYQVRLSGLLLPHLVRTLLEVLAGQFPKGTLSLAMSHDERTDSLASFHSCKDDSSQEGQMAQL